MKRIFTILIALMAMTFTQCKPAPEGGEDNTTRKVKVSCSISMNKNSRSDFSQLMTEGNIRWSDGRECVYLAVHGETPQIIELEAWADGDPLRLEFEGEASEGLIVSGQEYDIWYFGHSQQLETPYINMTDEDSRLEGSIATQSGRLEDLGYCHIATTKVTAVTENDEVKLNLKGTLVNQIAIALLDLENVEELYGDAILGTEYALEYNGERYELNVTESKDAKIKVESATGISYVVLLPNANKETMIKHKKEDKTFAYTFHNYIKSNKIYYRTATDDKVALKWEEIEEEPEMPEPEQPGDNNNHEYVDLGLPSGLLWATCNVGAETPEEYGDYFAWGETSTKETYTADNCATYNVLMNDISGNAQYDAATANWGGNWRMPTYDELKELKDNCTWTWITQNGVNGYNVEGPNGNSIFLPAAGYRLGSSLGYAGSDGFYLSSAPRESNSYDAYCLIFYSGYHYVGNGSRGYGHGVRPVFGGDFEGPAAQYATVTTSEVTEITSSSAICGGNVTTDNGSAVTAKGVCWSTNQNPTIEDNKTTDGSGVGSFTSQIPNLVPNTQYYVRAYATNEAGTSYGEQKSFTTLTSGPNANNHEYVDLGLSVKWATCNVGANAPEEYGDYYAWGETEPAPNNDYISCPTWGLSYTELLSQGYIDSEGNLTSQYDAATANWGGDWRMPTYDELNELRTKCTWTWTIRNGVNGYNVEGPSGASIFLPAAGYRNGSSLNIAGIYGGFWSSAPCRYDEYNDFCAYEHAYLLGFGSDNLLMNVDNRFDGLSVRPVSGGDFEGPAAQYATIRTSEVTDITSNSAICGGNVITDNGSAVTAKGVCWSTNPNPTIEDNKTTDGNGLGNFTSNLSNLEPQTTYYVRAYATNAAGTSYGEQKSFTTLTAGPNANGHEYVDLGLPSGLLWATCNVGANAPEGYGDYYAWGETTTKSDYSSSNSATYGLSISELQSQGYIDGEGKLTAQYDAATANWGGDWRMPTSDEMKELVDNCEWEWTQINGVYGSKVVGPNKNYIFFPAAGSYYGSLFSSDGSIGWCWSSNPDDLPSFNMSAYYLSFNKGYEYVEDNFNRFYGLSVRPVVE